MSVFSESDAQRSLFIAVEKLDKGAYDDSIVICRDLLATIGELEDRQLAAQAHLVAGRAYLLLGQFELSTQELKMGLQLDPSQTQGYVDLGTISSKRKLHAEAIAYYRKALENPHIDANLRFTLATGLLHERQYEDAFSELGKLSSTTDHGFSRGGLLILRGIAWWQKLDLLCRLLLVLPFAIVLMLPLTRVWVWTVVTLVTLGILVVLQRSQLLREVAGPIVYMYILSTVLFVMSMWWSWN